MSLYGPTSRVILVRHMQLGGDLQNCWLMFSLVKRVQEWTTMACHVYNLVYCKAFTIAVYDMQSESIEAQYVMWTKLNQVMIRFGLAHPNFKGFMVDSAQVN